MTRVLARLVRFVDDSVVVDSAVWPMRQLSGYFGARLRNISFAEIYLVSGRYVTRWGLASSPSSRLRTSSYSEKFPSNQRT